MAQACDPDNSAGTGEDCTQQQQQQHAACSASPLQKPFNHSLVMQTVEIASCFSGYLQVHTENHQLWLQQGMEWHAGRREECSRGAAY
jgi:hypothetical protein